MPKHYYAARETEYGYRWIIYHYEGLRTVIDHSSPSDAYDTKERALDGAAEFLDENNLDAEME